MTADTCEFTDSREALFAARCGDNQCPCVSCHRLRDVS